MLLVYARCAPSNIHGIGLFARQPIAAGTMVWMFNPAIDVRLTQDQIEQLPSPARKQAIHYTFRDEHTGMFVLPGDDDRFTNHSDTPNTRVKDGNMIAIVDIQEGDEITCDYNEIGALLIT